MSEEGVQPAYEEYPQPEEPQPQYYEPERRSDPWKWIVLVVAVAYVAGSLYFILDMRTRLKRLEHTDDSTRSTVYELNKRLASTQAATETLASQLGMTQKELTQRAVTLQRQQHAAEARLAEQQQQQISKVTGELTGVKGDVGGVKSDVAAARNDLEATKARLDRAIGDLGVQSGLIARTRDDLEALKHKGDRQYYEFTVLKNKRFVPVSTVSLQLKKADPKRGKFTMNVLADDHTIEKKDRNINEPIQFYTGRDRMLYEVVVWTVEKNKISGYLTTPKNAPQPLIAQ